jgi:integrase
VSQLLGHSTIEMTMRYSHLSPDHRMKAVERMADLMSFSQNMDRP